MRKLTELFSTEHHNVVMTALACCADDFDQERKHMKLPEGGIYGFLESTPKTSLVAELKDKIYELGYKIVKQER